MFRVTIDPGHGGGDPGAVGPTGVREKDVTLSVARLLAEQLAPVAEVLLTRDGDYTPGGDPNSELRYRAAMANSWQANVFVSVHCNAAKDRSAGGTETYCAPGSARGNSLAASIQQRLVGALGLQNRGVKLARYAVLVNTTMPAALVELAFISNPVEEALLATQEFQAKAALAIAQGIAEYFGVTLPEGGDQKMFGKRQPEPWKLNAVKRALSEGLITEVHDPLDPPDKAFVLQTELNLLDKVREMLRKCGLS